ncbi:MAG TPA: DUF1707 domain-containing protein [Solirubrobacteraceae bacterium]
MADTGHIRASDAEREALIEDLREHTVAGRLSPEELEERIGVVYAAKTRAELDAVRADLPLTALAVRKAYVQRRAQLRGRLVQEAGGSLTASGICVGIWFAAGAHGQFWPIWVIVFTLLPLLRDSWRLLGPGSNLDAVEARLQARHERHLGRQARRSRRHLLP